MGADMAVVVLWSKIFFWGERWIVSGRKVNWKPRGLLLLYRGRGGNSHLISLTIAGQSMLYVVIRFMMSYLLQIGHIFSLEKSVKPHGKL
jgi:hypothetical protein